MGCWNGTCGLSNLPILYGDKVVCFIVKRDEYGEKEGIKHECYPWDRSSPLTFPLVGYYDDYGGIEKIEPSPHIDFIIEYFKKLFDSDKLDYDKYYGEKGVNTINDVVRLVERGCFTNAGNKRYFGLYMVHYDLYMKMSDYTLTAEQIKFAKMSLWLCDTFRSTLKKIVAEKEGKEYIEPWTKEDQDWFQEIRYEDNYLNVGSFLQESFGMREIDDKYTDDAIRLFIFATKLSILRKSFYSGSGAGGQDCEYDEFINAYTMFGEFAKHLNKRWDE